MKTEKRDKIMMDKITGGMLSMILSFMILSTPLFATTVNYQSWYFTGTTNNRPITITLLSQGVLYNGAAVFGIPQTFQPVGGVVSTNLVPANYTITVGGNGIPYPFSVPNTTNVYNIWDLVNAGLYVLTPTNAVLNGASNTVFNTATLNGGTINNAFLFSPYIGQDTNWITLWAPNSSQNLMSYGYHVQPGYVLNGVSNITVWTGQTVNNAAFAFVNDPGNLVFPHLQWGFGNTNDLINGYTNPPMAFQDQINSANGPNAYWHVGTNAGIYPGLWPGFLAAYGTNLPPLMMASNMNAQKVIANEIRAHGIIQSEQLAILSNSTAISMVSSNIQATNTTPGTIYDNTGQRIFTSAATTRLFWDGTSVPGVNSADMGGRFLVDSAGFNSIDWGNRLFDVFNGSVVAIGGWNTLGLFASGGLMTNLNLFSGGSVNFSLTNSTYTDPLSGSVASLTNFEQLLNANDSQSRADILPFRGEWSSTWGGVTNEINWLNSNPNCGYNIMGMDIGIWYPTTAGSGLYYWNTNGFGTDPSTLRTYLHTNGFRWLIWMDPFNAGPGTTNAAQWIKLVQTALSFNPDIIWIGTSGNYQYLAEQCFLTNASPVQSVFNAAIPPSQADLNSIKLGNCWRYACGSVPDYTTITNFEQNLCPNVAAYGWKYTGLGQFMWPGWEALSSLGAELGCGGSAVILTAMWGGALMAPFCGTNTFTLGYYHSMTNKVILDIQADPAGICANLAAVSNGCMYWVKPLRTPNGPSYAVAIFNTNSYSTNTSCAITNLNLQLGRSGSLLQWAGSWTVADLLTNNTFLGGYTSLAGDFQTNLSVTGLASNQTALFLLSPQVQSVQTAPITVFYPPKTLDVDNNFSAVNYSAQFGPINNATAYNGWKDTANGAHNIIVAIPDWPSTVTVRHWITFFSEVGGVSSSTWTNTYAIAYMDFLSGAVNEQTITQVLSPTNGENYVQYTIYGNPNPGRGYRYINEVWGASTNTLLQRVIGNTSITYR